MSKICTKCNLSKDDSEFRSRYDKRKDLTYSSSSCKSCEREYSKSRYQNNSKYKQSNKITSKKFREDNPDYHKNYEYTLTQEQTVKYKEKAKEYYQKNKDKIKSYQRQYNKTDSCKNSKLKNKYSITLQQYNQMIYEQNNKCLICSCEFSTIDKSRKPNVDHCHKTNKVRGILCHKCNTGIGLLNENLEVLQKAIEYLTVC